MPRPRTARPAGAARGDGVPAGSRRGAWGRSPHLTRKPMTGRYSVCSAGGHRSLPGLLPAPAMGTVWGTAGDAGRTPWGDPDLQGLWSYATLTPLQRPADVEGRGSSLRPKKWLRGTSRASRIDRIGPAWIPAPTTRSGLTAGKCSRTAARRRSSIRPTAACRSTPKGQRRVDAKREHRRMHPAGLLAGPADLGPPASPTTACLRSAPATTTRTTSCRHPSSLPSTLRTSTMSGSFR